MLSSWTMTQKGCNWMEVPAHIKVFSGAGMDLKVEKPGFLLSSSFFAITLPASARRVRFEIASMALDVDSLIAINYLRRITAFYNHPFIQEDG